MKRPVSACRHLCYISPLKHEVLSSYERNFNSYLTRDTARREYLCICLMMASFAKVM
jgi:hypothetical protein